jgi:DNA modification methylase
MFSFVGDTVLDPFMGTGTTLVASAKCERNAIGVEIEPSYVEHARWRLEKRTTSLFGGQPELIIAESAAGKARKVG